MRVLDLGCGYGCDLSIWGVGPVDQVVGLDIDASGLRAAKRRFTANHYLQGSAELLPFANESFDYVICALALPYTDIPLSLQEIHRTLAPGGKLSLSLHLPSFTLREFAKNAFPEPIAMLYRLYVLVNGLWFHFTGRTKRFRRNRTESFQTERGMLLALRHAGFSALSFSRKPGPVSEMFFVEACKHPARTDWANRSTDFEDTEFAVNRKRITPELLYRAYGSL